MIGVGEGGEVGDSGFPEDEYMDEGISMGDLISDEEITVGVSKKPQTFWIPSREYGITAQEAADILQVSREIRANKKLLKATLFILLAKKRAIEDIVR